jgi:uncharacterized membrane protein
VAERTANPPPERARGRFAAFVRVTSTGSLGIVVAVILLLTGVAWQVGLLVGWDVTAISYVAWVWLLVHHFDSDRTRTHANAVHESEADANVVLILACLASLLGVVFALRRASGLTGAPRAWTTLVAILSVGLAWTVVHVVFMLRYADLYYDQERGIEFPGPGDPDYRDFAYVAFTIGMTYQVSDTNITSKKIRRQAIRHALLSFVFGTAVIAMTINVVAGLLNK